MSWPQSGMSVWLALAISVAGGAEKATARPAASGRASVHLTAEEIATRYSGTIAVLFGLNEAGEATSLGTGVVVAKRGWIVTNLHVVRDCRRIRIVLDGYSKGIVDGVLASSEEDDLALLDFGSALSVCAPLGDSDSLRMGEDVVVLSNPEGLQRSVSTGIVSALRSTEDGNRLVQFTAPVSHGSSGGAVFDRSGRVIAIVASQLSEGQNLNFGVPSNRVRALMSALHPESLPELQARLGPSSPSGNGGDESGQGAANESARFGGSWEGVVANFTHGIRTRMQLTIGASDGVVGGRVLIEPPLYGSGPITGTCSESVVKFTSICSYPTAITIEWEGQVMGVTVFGTYRVQETRESGTWWATR